MLERLGLAIDAERFGHKGWYRTISDAVTGQALGHAIKADDAGWWQPNNTAVYELPDDSLLLSLRGRRWWGGTNVTDANGLPLAELRRRRIHGPDGRLWIEWNRHASAFRLATGVEAATATWKSGRVVMQFHRRIAGEPLLKMALLAAVL